MLGLDNFVYSFIYNDLTRHCNTVNSVNVFSYHVMIILAIQDDNENL